MKTGPQIALAVGIGYVLGRTRKMKLAITVGGMLVGRRLPTDPKELLARGGKLIEASPALSKLTGEARQNMMDVVRSAAVSAASNKIESMGENLSRRAENLRSIPSPRAAEKSEESETAEREGSDTEERSESEERADEQRRTKALAGRTHPSRADGGSDDRDSGKPRSKAAAGSSRRARTGAATRSRSAKSSTRPRGGDDG